MHTTMKSHALSSDRRKRVLSVAFAASIGLYLLAALAVEPMRGFAQDSETAVVEVTIAAAIGLACDADGDLNEGSGETLNLGTITYTGDTGVYSDNRAVFCWISTNNAAGWTLAWQVVTGSGGSSTGHMINQTEDIIEAISTASNTTASWSVAASDSRWGGRVSSTSSGSISGALDFGTDAVSETWTRVATGSTQTIRTSDSQSQSGSGDLVKIGFRAEVGAAKVQPTGTYQATVTFTATNQ